MVKYYRQGFILLLFLLWLLCAYYLFSTIWESQEIPLKFQPEFSTSEKYLTYLPHSGFHNQRIELENALFLAKLLNRTVLLPPALLGPPIPWRTFNSLHNWLSGKSKRSLGHCKNYKLKELPLECAGYETWTKLPWRYFFDMDAFRGKIKFQQQTEFASNELANYGIDAEDIHYVKDTTLYNYTIVDRFNSTFALNQFSRAILVSELADIPQKLIFFGSLFSSWRIQTDIPENTAYFQQLRRKLVYDSPVVHTISKRISAKLGGSENYYGIHLRASDFYFAEDLGKNLMIILDEIKQMLRTREDQQAMGVSGSRFEMGQSHSLESCLTRSRLRSPVIYLATDLKNPREEDALSPLFKEFPCTFVYSDFKSETASLYDERNPEDSISLTPHLIPMVDSVVASRGYFFVGTPRSTFSKYALRLHEVYFGRKDPIDIIL
ncbi:hypothetical protein K493DRAFT_302894 [Basidiobolus meristosporus CBS 931.73]|uniref:O-fucosyltransferase family protein n=1 Tax=Basidiobolus meristosporus CBS 931.73 TaxID=1314790 RepID=A0A1Y1Y4Y4_9FUNG|nr:hypothetical protein K493DRAFT_302894 [Basidiobolus meristosporus CBS 931.73]|eukprot:ORX93091.1 hypothetical protein K493DRAFT_302894 [Basidiobolus meristosporus CBS 931.73]